MMMTRICTTRVRSGCLTCKRRRKKCDEKKPFCGNCVSTKRACQGYVDPFRQVNRGTKSEPSNGSYPMGLPRLGSLQIADPSTCHDYVCFRYLSEDILGCSSEFLVREAMQRSLSHPTIRHALLALSTHLQSFAQDHRARNLEVTRNTYSLRHYGQALIGIRETLSSKMNEEQQIEILTAVFLIIGVELVRENGPAALSHLIGALGILSASTMALRLLPDEDDTILTALRALYVRLELHTLAFVGSWLPTTSLLGPDSVSDLEQHMFANKEMPIAWRRNLARNSLMCLKYRSYQAMRCDSLETSTEKPGSHDLQVKGQALIKTVLADLESWFRLFQPVLETTMGQTCARDSSDVKIALECRILLIQYFLLSTRLSNCGSEARETTFDTFGDSFEAIIHHAEAVVGAKQPCLLTLDIGLIEPLYFTVVKCREPQKRLKALHLLDSCTQEAAWDGPLTTAIAKHIISVEAALLGNHKDQPAACTEESLLKFKADLVWQYRESPRAEDYRVHAVALQSNWGLRTAVVEAYYAGGTVKTLCAASSQPMHQAY